MLLVIDIGNTNVVVGCFEGKCLRFHFRLKSTRGRTCDEYALFFSSILKEHFKDNYQFNGCVISSVVPPLTGDIAKLIENLFNITPLIVGPGIKTGLPIKLTDPALIGADRVVNSIAGKEKFGVPVLVIDFGTAITFDYVGSDGAYEGGLIVPGLEISLECLVSRTAKLPKIDIAWPKNVVGKSTIAAMQSGALFGYLSLVEGVIIRVENEVGEKPSIISTGGLGKIFEGKTERIIKYEPFLTLEGLRIVARMNGLEES